MRPKPNSPSFLRTKNKVGQADGPPDERKWGAAITSEVGNSTGEEAIKVQ